MDTSDYPSLPDLSQIHARLASNSRRVESVIDSQLDGIERLFSASTSEDWAAVANASRQLAEMTLDEMGPDVLREARHVFDELSHASTKQPKHLVSLLAACRVVRKRRVRMKDEG